MKVKLIGEIYFDIEKGIGHIKWLRPLNPVDALDMKNDIINQLEKDYNKKEQLKKIRKINLNHRRLNQHGNT